MFAFDLALALGKDNPDAMLASIPLAIFYDWMEYAKRKPFGDERADLRIALMASALVNKRPYSYGRTRPIDFMPFSNGHKKQSKQTAEEMYAILRGVVATHQQQTKKIAEANANRS